jgi:hypothetical protein
MAFVEDLTIFFDDFGIDVAFKRGSTSLLTATVILDAPADELAVYDRSFFDEKFYAARVTGAKVSLLAIASEVASLQLNDTGTINGSDWYVIGLEPDGTGLMSLHLSIHRA